MKPPPTINVFEARRRMAEKDRRIADLEAQLARMIAFAVVVHEWTEEGDCPQVDLAFHDISDIWRGAS